MIQTTIVFICVDFEIVAVTRHMCMMCIPSISKALWSWGLLLAVEGVVVVPLPAMTCAMCLEPFAGDGSPAVLLTCSHTFHEVCLDEYRKARGLDSNKAMKCPTCKFAHAWHWRDMAEKEAAAQFLVAGDACCRTMDADGACAERPAKKFRSEDGECASPIDADGA